MSDRSSPIFQNLKLPRSSHRPPAPTDSNGHAAGQLTDSHGAAPPPSTSSPLVGCFHFPPRTLGAPFPYLYEFLPRPSRESSGISASLSAPPSSIERSAPLSSSTFGPAPPCTAANMPSLDMFQRRLHTRYIFPD